MTKLLFLVTILTLTVPTFAMADIGGAEISTGSSSSGDGE